MKISLKQLASACTVASKAHPEIALGKSQNLRINPSFGSTTEELISGAIDGNTIAQAELARRAAKKNMTIEAFLKGKASSQARREAKQQEKATPIAAAPAPVQQENVVSLQSMQSELQRLMSLIASMAEKKQETPAAVAPAAAPAPVLDKVLKTNCIKAAMAAIKSEDRAALKAELINLGVIDGSSKMRFSKMVDLFNENFQVKVSKHNAPASTPKVIASANLSVGNIQFTD
jgi:hypothetical protein